MQRKRSFIAWAYLENTVSIDESIIETKLTEKITKKDYINFLANCKKKDDEINMFEQWFYLIYERFPSIWDKIGYQIFFPGYE